MVNFPQVNRICLIVEPPHWTRRSLGEPWLFEVIREYEEVEFTIVVVGQSGIEDVQETGFPENVKSVKIVNLDDGFKGGGKDRRLNQRKFGHLVQKIASMVEGESIGMESMREVFIEMSNVAPDASFETVWRDPVVWELITSACEMHEVKIPFTDYYEIVEFVVRPIWNLLSVTKEIPEVDLFHGVGGSYAGLLSVTLAEKTGAKSVFTDNRRAPARQLFRYMRESWAENMELRPRLKMLMDHKQLWLDKTYSFVCNYSGQVVSGSRPAAKLIAERSGLKKPVMRIGIGTEKESSRRSRLRRRSLHPNEFLIAAIFERNSRSDVEMFLSSAGAVDRQFENCRFQLWGSWSDDDKGLLKKLAISLAPIADLEFLHINSIEDSIDEIDIAVISGQAELGDQLLGVMFNAQIPVIATEVDKFSGLLESLDTDRLSDFIIEVGAGDASDMEEALLRFLSNHRLYEAAGRSARRHLNRNFAFEDMINDYGRVYQLIP